MERSLNNNLPQHIASFLSYHHYLQGSANIIIIITTTITTMFTFKDVQINGSHELRHTRPVLVGRVPRLEKKTNYIIFCTFSFKSLQIANHKIQMKNYKFQVTNYKSQIITHLARVRP